MSNRIDSAFAHKKDLLNIYFTAGYPNLDDTIRIATELEQAGADMLEIGIPFSDPVADGPVIQESSEVALGNGMTMKVLFEQLQTLRDHVNIPVLLMGYVNPIIQYGIEKFCKQCSSVGIDCVIIPDLPMQEYLNEYKKTFDEYGVHNIFLVSPNTSDERIRLIDTKSGGFIYVVSSASITGAKSDVQSGQNEYFQRINDMGLAHPTLIGFGISNKETFDNACAYSNGAIIGSAFVTHLKKGASSKDIHDFIHAIKAPL